MSIRKVKDIGISHDKWVYGEVIDRGAFSSGYIWGGNYVFDPSGLQQDIIIIARKLDASGSWEDRSVQEGSVMLSWRDAKTISFSPAYRSAPSVVLTASGDPSGYYAFATNVTTTGATVLMDSPSGLSYGADVSGLYTFYWIAKGSI